MCLSSFDERTVLTPRFRELSERINERLQAKGAALSIFMCVN
jgi:hypothetical protein